MKKAIFLIGRLNESEESYQLMIGNNYLTTTYNKSTPREEFYAETIDRFVTKILQEKSPLEGGVFNGLRINPESGDNEKITKLEEALFSQFHEKIRKRIEELTLTKNEALSRN
jgi:hypothetical protein